MNLLDLFIKVGIDDQATDGISGIADKAKNVAGALGDGLATAAKVGLASVGAVSAGVAAMTGKALSAAGELEQNMGGSEAVFKEYAEGMQDAAVTAYENMGLSASGFLATANKMGALFQGAGFDIGESASIAADAMQRAADVASIMGLDVSAAMESVAGAAKGNFTMMDNLGVAINDTTLQQYALEKGIAKTTQQMTTQEKVGLAMELFMERTAYATGNYARENATLAGSLGTAKAALTDFLSGAGSADALVSSFSNAAKVIQNNVIEILPRLVESGAAAVEALAPQIPVMFDQILPVAVESIASVMGTLGSAIVSNIPQILETVGTLVDGFVAKFEQITGIDLSPLTDTFQRAGEIIQKFFDLFSDGISEKIDSAGNSVRDFLGFFTESAAAGLNLVLDVIESLIDNWEITISVLAGVTAALVAYKAAMAISTLIDTVKNAMNGLTIAQKAAAVAQAALNVVMNANPFVLIATLIIGIVTALVTFVANNEEAQAKLKEIWEAIKGFFLDAAEKIKAGWDTVIAFFKSIPGTLKSFFTGIGDWFQNIGAQIVDGIKTGISNAWNGLTSFVGGLWDKLFGKSEEVNEIHSPSRRYSRLAGMIVSGIEGGWADNFYRVIDQATEDFNRLAGIGDAVAMSAAPVPTATVDFSASALGKSSAATINSMLAVSGNGGMPTKIEVPVYLNGRRIAQATYDDLKQIEKQKG